MKHVQRTCSRGHVFLGEEPCPSCWPGYRTYECEATVWLYPGESAQWHFVTLPARQAALIQERFAAQKRGFGSVPVSASIGGTTWNTSIFPDKKSGSYLLPLKADVRKREGISAGQAVRFSVTVLL